MPLLDVSSHRGIFLDRLREQRDIVNAFYHEEIERSREQLLLLLAQMAALAGGGSEPTSSIGDSGSASESSLVRASTDLYRRLQQLRNYAILNYTGLVKLAKKFDKARGGGADGVGTIKVPPLLADWTAELKESGFLHADALDTVITQLEETFAKHFCDGSVQVARATLLVRKERPNSKLLLMLGLRVGVASMLAFWLLWDLLVDVRIMDLGGTSKRSNSVWQATQMPLYRAGGAMVLMQLLWACCLYILNRARINFEFMLDFGPRANTNAADVASSAVRTLIFYLLSLLLFSKALIGELPKSILNPGVFPVAMVFITFASFLLPFQQGAGLLSAISHVLMAPFVQVDLVTVLVGDVITSLVKPLQDLALTVCYIGTREFYYPIHYRGNAMRHHSIMRC